MEFLSCLVRMSKEFGRAPLKVVSVKAHLAGSRGVSLTASTEIGGVRLRQHVEQPAVIQIAADGRLSRRSQA